MPRMGRPELDDDATLLAMAEVVLEDPNIAIADAVRRVIADFSFEQSEEAAIRRLRDKFKRKSPELLALVKRNPPKRRVHAMFPNRVSFQPAAFFKVSEVLQRSINIPEIRRLNEQLVQAQKQLVSPEMQRISAEMAHFSERMQRAFNTPEMQRIRKNLEAASKSFNTPEMRHRIEQAQKASHVISRLNLQRFA